MKTVLVALAVLLGFSCSNDGGVPLSPGDRFFHSNYKSKSSTREETKYLNAYCQHENDYMTVLSVRGDWVEVEGNNERFGRFWLKPTGVITICPEINELTEPEPLGMIAPSSMKE
jgi:hypothetical protein